MPVYWFKPSKLKDLLWVNTADRFDFRARAVAIVIVFRFGGFDVAHYDNTGEVGDVGLVELRELSFGFGRVLAVGTSQHEAAEIGFVVLRLLAVTELCAGDGKHVALDERESCADLRALGRHRVFLGFEGYREEVALAGFGLDNFCLVDDEGLFSFNKDRGGGVSVVECE